MADQPKFIAPPLPPTPQSVFARAASLAAHNNAELVLEPEPEPELLVGGELASADLLYPAITHVGDVAIIERQLGVGPHPRTKTPIPFKNVLHVLLADGRELYICPWIDDEGHPCGYVGETTLGVNSHYTTKHMRTEYRRYSDEILKAVMRAVAEAKQTSGRDYMARAAMILNGRGLRTVSKTDWTASSVSSIWAAYHEQFPVRTPRRTGGVRTGAGRPAGSPNSPDTNRSKIARAKKAGKTLDGLRTVAVMLVEEIDALIASGVGEPDPKMAAKAEAWDQMQRNMRALSD